MLTIGLLTFTCLLVNGIDNGIVTHFSHFIYNNWAFSIAILDWILNTNQKKVQLFQDWYGFIDWIALRTECVFDNVMNTCITLISVVNEPGGYHSERVSVMRAHLTDNNKREGRQIRR